MFIFRVECLTENCGEWVAGHGPCFSSRCLYRNTRPYFGTAGMPPYIIARWQRCAVTAEQFDRWLDESPESTQARIDESNGAWAFIAYWVDDDGNAWEVENDQVLFDPEDAIRIGPVHVDEILSLRDEAPVFIG